MKRLALVTALFFAAASPVLGAEEKKADNTQAVTISPVALPIVVKGRLVNYVFVTVRLDLSNSANAIKLRDKEPYFRDALVRAGHRTPFTLMSDLTKIDEAKLQTAMLREANAIAGAGSVRGVTVVSQAPKSLRVSP